MTTMPSELPFRRHFTHQSRKTAPKIIIARHNGKPDTKPNTASAKMPSEAVSATILIQGALHQRGALLSLTIPFDSQINSAFACQKQNQYFAVRIGTFIKHQISMFRVSGNSRLAKPLTCFARQVFKTLSGVRAYRFDPHFRQSTLPTVAAFLFDIQSHFQKTYAGNKIIRSRLANIPTN